MSGLMAAKVSIEKGGLRRLRNQVRACTVTGGIKVGAVQPVQGSSVELLGIEVDIAAGTIAEAVEVGIDPLFSSKCFCVSSSSSDGKSYMK